MNISFESELMENRKHAVVMAPDRAFDVLQSQDADALFFSIGTDSTFYLTREVTQSATGWNKLDLSSALSSQHGGAAVAAKAFSVAQNAQTLAIDLALVLTVGGADFLYLSLGNANTDEAWANGVTWTIIPFDAGTPPNPLTIADVLVMNIPASNGGEAVENIFVDILRTPGDPLELLDRYYIKSGGSPQWNVHRLGFDLAAGSISSCLGQRTNDPIPGIYTFGSISNEQEILFTLQHNYFQPTHAPPVARLTVPAGASAIASALNASGVSNLFVAGTQGLFLFAPDNQADFANPVQILTDALVAGASALAAATDANHTAVWGVNPQRNLFYVTCPAGSEADPAAWSKPVPLLPSVEGFAFFLNLRAGNNVLFAHVDAQNLLQVAQDPVTTDWLQRSILLPSTSPNDVTVYNSVTTHIRVTDDNAVGAPNAAVSVTATSPVSVYMNDVYYLLSPNVAVNTTTDPTGVLTVVQETQSLSAVCFRVALTDAPQIVAAVNPMANAQAKLSTIKPDTDLGAVQVTNADGSQQSLVPSTVSSDDKKAAASAIAQFVQVSSGLPQDGSRQQSGVSRPAAGVPRTWGVSFAGGRLEYHEGEDTAQYFGLRTGFLQSADSGIQVAAGDFFRWIKQGFAEIESFTVQAVDGVYHFFAKIAGEVYDVLLDCLAAVAHGVEYIFSKISVWFQDLIKWLGFIFQWQDVIRTHRVLKNVLYQYLARCISDLGVARVQLQNSFTDVQTYIDGWAGIAENIPASLSGTTLNGTTASSTSAPGQYSPQSNWGIHHLKSNAASGSTTAQPNEGVMGDILGVLQPLIDAVDREKDVFQDAFSSFKSDIIDKIHDLSFTDLVKALVAIIVDALLQSIENVLLAAIDALIALLKGALDALNATIDIPVISSLYKEVTRDDMSLLDVTCLVAAIPVTVAYRSITKAAPFPDSATTTALINAPDFATIQQICNSSATVRSTTAHGRARGAGDLAIDPDLNKQLVLAGGIYSAVGAGLLCIFSPLKQKFPQVMMFPVINGLSYLLYVAPDVMGQIPDLQNKKWWAIMNQIVADLMVVKSLIDMFLAMSDPDPDSPTQKYLTDVSPWIDFGGNILWQVPTTAAALDPENVGNITIDMLNYYAGTAFDCNGIMSPVVADDSDPTTWAIAVGIATFFNLAYGSMSCAASVLTVESSGSSGHA
jgi:hypothetical protein